MGCKEELPTSEGTKSSSLLRLTPVYAMVDHDNETILKLGTK